MKQAWDTAKYMQLDGVSSSKYFLKATVLEQLYTKFVVEVPGPTKISEVKDYFLRKIDQYKLQTNNTTGS